MPSYLSRIDSSSAADDAMSVKRKWLNTRKLSTLASRIANAVVSVHGNGMPRIELKTGPYRVHHNVCVTVDIEPSPFLTVTVTVLGSIAVGVPSYRYCVGWPGT